MRVLSSTICVDTGPKRDSSYPGIGGQVDDARIVALDLDAVITGLREGSAEVMGNLLNDQREAVEIIAA